MSTTPARPLLFPATRALAVAEHLRGRIRSGKLQPGARLRQNVIAAELGVSSTPVREAFRLLEREGLVSNRSHRGVVVFNPTFEEFEQAYEIRIPLECALLARAIPNYTEADLAALRALVTTMAATDGDPERMPDLNERYHARLYSPARRPRLEAMVQALRGETVAYMRWAAPIWPDFNVTKAQHQAIYDACAARDVERAIAELRVHLQYSVDVIAASLGQRPAEEEQA